MPNGEIRTSNKKLTAVIIAAALLALACQFGFYLALTSRIQQGEERIYTDLHDLRMKMIEWERGVQ
ncbi:hypothetical protein [Saccharothrix sp. HUAS TT1]|uniref:hypothetical protein n=1 Tax=unclassified Saccharothrix TaxID=2593673 RepID=UPI00345B883D